MFEVVDLVVGCSAFRHETASDVNVLFSPLPVCASLSAVCQLTLNDKPVVSKMEGGGVNTKLCLSLSVSDSAVGFAEAYDCELFIWERVWVSVNCHWIKPIAQTFLTAKLFVHVMSEFKVSSFQCTKWHHDYSTRFWCCFTGAIFMFLNQWQPQWIPYKQTAACIDSVGNRLFIYLFCTISFLKIRGLFSECC